MAAPETGELDDKQISVLHGVARRTALRILHDWHLSEDVAQEAITCLWLRLSSPANGESEPVRHYDSWVASTARYLAYGVLSGRRSEMPLASSSSYGLIHDATTLTDIETSLPRLVRAAFHLRFLDRRTFKEIASILQCPVGTAKSRVARAKHLVRQCLHDARPDLPLSRQVSEPGGHGIPP
jgi:DNA-directed RNA polymerase specialized sigma24 family protein